MALGALRAAIKRTVEQTAGERFERHLAKGRFRGHTAILAFHNVVDDATDATTLDTSLHLRVADFVSIIEAFVGNPAVRFAALTELLEPATDLLRIIVTFDDAYRGAIRLGLPVLARHRIPSTVFVAPALLGAPTVWWDHAALQHHGPQGTAWDVYRERMLAPPFAGIGVRMPDMQALHGETTSSDIGIATRAELTDAVAGDLVHIGCHTWSHACLPALTRAEVHDELARSRDWLASSDLPTVPVHAYPYGRFGARDEAVLRELGYLRALRVDGGVWAPSHEAFSLPRINIPAGVTANGVRARLAGVRRA